MREIIDWINTNSGFVSVLIFLITLLLGWVSGIFQALRRKPKFKIEVIPGPTMCSTFYTRNKHNEYDAHRTAISIYLKITNIGNAPSDIAKIEVGYHWSIKGYSLDWLKFHIGWDWLRQPTVVKEDFHTALDSDNTKYFPFLLQHSTIAPETTKTYLDIGMKTEGIVYFEGAEQWGGAFPYVKNNQTKLKIRVYDTFSGAHEIIKSVPCVDIIDAKKYCSQFGETYSGLNKHNKIKEKEI